MPNSLVAFFLVSFPAENLIIIVVDTGVATPDPAGPMLNGLKVQMNLDHRHFH